jgi:ubiquinone biosynthesis protein
MPVTPRHLNRYRKIVEVFARHGFGALLGQLDLDRRIIPPRYWFRKERPEPPGRTPAEHLRLALEELGPTFVKFGQILSTRPDLLPPEFIVELSRLQDEVPPLPWEIIKPRIESELDRKLEDLFAYINPTPIAAASLGQVHSATLKDGQRVVIKVQRPDIRRNINLDLDIMRDLAGLAQENTSLGKIYDFRGVVEEFAVALIAELDYRREGRNADRFRKNFKKKPYLIIPHVYWEYTTERILMMERISGIKISDIEAIDNAGYDRHQVALHAANMIIQEILEDGYFHADPHPGNFVVMEGDAIGIMDFGRVGYLDSSDTAILVRLFIYAVQMDTPGIVDQLIRLGVADEQTDRRALERDLRRIMQRYYGLPLREISVRELIVDLTALAFRYHLRVPSNLWLLLNTLAMMEGVGLTLDPEFDIFEVSEPYVRRFILRLWLPTEWGPSVIRGATDWADLLLTFPRESQILLRQATRGTFSANLHLPDLKDTTDRLDRIANRLIITILVATILLGSAILIPNADLTWPWGIVTWVLVGAFLISFFLSIWLLWNIWRSGR